MRETFSVIGLVLIIVGIWQGWAGLSIWPVEQDVANLLAMHIRETTITVAAVAFLAGVLFVCTAALLTKPPSG